MVIIMKIRVVDAYNYLFLPLYKKIEENKISQKERVLELARNIATGLNQYTRPYCENMMSYDEDFTDNKKSLNSCRNQTVSFSDIKLGEIHDFVNNDNIGGKSKTNKTRKTNKRKKTNKRRKTKSKTNKRKKRTRRTR